MTRLIVNRYKFTLKGHFIKFHTNATCHSVCEPVPTLHRSSRTFCQNIEDLCQNLLFNFNVFINFRVWNYRIRDYEIRDFSWFFISRFWNSGFWHFGILKIRHFKNSILWNFGILKTSGLCHSWFWHFGILKFQDLECRDSALSGFRVSGFYTDPHN